MHRYHRELNIVVRSRDHFDLDDFLIADDPAMFSDEFSGPEDWG